MHLYIIQEIKTKAYLAGNLMEVDEMDEHKPKVLIVDDSKNIRKLVGVVLGKDNYETYEAGNGLDALEMVKRYSPDIVILDMIIPAVNGIEVCRKIKANHETRDTSVIFLTSEATDEAREKAHEVGAEIYMTKPFEPRDLRNAVKEVLGAKKRDLKTWQVR